MAKVPGEDAEPGTFEPLIWCRPRARLLAARVVCGFYEVREPREVPRADLDEIFPAVHGVANGLRRAEEPRRRRRGSSANWRKDGLREAEILRYKSQMGQCRRGSCFPRAGTAFHGQSCWKSRGLEIAVVNIER
ncbi:unnamed protein product [Symbiodinium natans]|uniref:Uncharacterized protein n=1 Tax=Symbiodinium natans TaxID=878477 RepID=A0A812QZN9_9DINO|nr:unnamed protein product [Symbiodinium natans]